MKKLLFIILFFSVFAADASHIVGGELFYDCLGNNQYKITLKLYRDCFCTNCAPYGDPEYLTIFDASGSLVAQPGMPFPGSVQLNPPITNSCMVQPSVCVERAIYIDTITLPPAVGGYDIVYQRCCRNNGVTNIPIDQGATYTVHIPDPSLATCNNSPRFNNFPPMYICVNAPLVFDHSATDPDGDNLVYSLCDPYDGATATCPNPSPAAGGGCSTVPPAPPYTSVIYNVPYNSSNFLNNPPNAQDLQIDPATGLLTGTPNGIGMFSVAVCVSEYRGGVLLGVMRRDFQFNVTQCNIPIAGIPTISMNTTTGIGLYILNCHNFTVTFQNTSYNPPPATTPLQYQWDFGDLTTNADTSSQQFPTYIYPDTGTYTVRLVVIKDDGGGGTPCYDTIWAYVEIYPTFTTDFITANVCSDSAAQFFDNTVSTEGNINQWSWNFGDGNTSNQTNPTHTYAPGTYNVTLIDENTLGCKDTLQKPITIYQTPNANFTFNTPCVNQLVNFANSSVGNISAYSWDFGSGSTSNQQNPAYTYTTAGNYPVELILITSDGCRDTSIQNITVNPLPVITVNNDTIICPFASVQLSAGNGGVSYLWTPSMGLSDSTISNPLTTPTPPNAVTYTVTVITAAQCPGQGSVTISFYPAPSVNAGPDTSICLNSGNFPDSVQLNATGSFSYRWVPTTSLSNSNIPNPVARPAITTTYSVFTTDVNGCKAADSLLVIVLDPALNIVLDNSVGICPGDTAYISAVDQGISNYIWSPAAFVTNPNSFNPGFFPPATTNYHITISNYCYTKDDSVLIIVYPIPIITLTPFDSICFGSSIQLSASGAAIYLWDSSATLTPLNISNPTATPDSTTEYYVNATSIHGCKNRDSARVFVRPLPLVEAGPDTLIYRDTYGELHGTTSANSFFWNPTTAMLDWQSLNTVITPRQSIWYTLSVVDEYGCTNKDSVLVTVEVFTILDLPTAFSPNGDGMNDVFRIVRWLNIEKIKEFAVYNRWGEKVFSTSDILQGWDGVYQNLPQPLGVYVWMVSALTKDNEEVLKKGNVTLLR